MVKVTKCHWTVHVKKKKALILKSIHHHRKKGKYEFYFASEHLSFRILHNGYGKYDMQV